MTNMILKVIASPSHQIQENLAAVKNIKKI